MIAKATKTVQILDRSRKTVATAQVSDDGELLSGSIDLRKMPRELRQLFEEFEEIVNGQMISFVDNVQERIKSLGLEIKLDDGSVVGISDLQIYPSVGDVSFRLQASGNRA
jgi:2-polyprenyl-3-methyl-5-hydroxy-6-metoxy-1,4-benzoquinol methylase